MRKIRVLEVGAGNFRYGGLSVIVWNWYKKFDHKKIHTDFAGCTVPEETYIKEIEKNGGDFFYLGSRSNLKQQLNKFFKMRSIVREKKYDCVHIHTHNQFNACVYYSAVKKYCSRVIIHSHSSDTGENYADSFPIGSVKRTANKISGQFISRRDFTGLACSKEAGEWMFTPKHKFTVINNGIETLNYVFNENMRKKVRSELNAGDRFVLGHVGRFAYEKNHDFLIDVFNEVHRKNTNSLLLLVGCGELEQAVRDKVHALGLDNDVIFYGTTSSVNKLYQAMDCFVFPSHFEGLGMAAVEAQAAGLKTLCSDNVPLKTKMTDLLEYMPLSETAEKWADKILSYDNGYERADMSAQIEQAGFDIRQSAKQLEELYFG